MFLKVNFGNKLLKENTYIKIVLRERRRDII